MNTIVWLFVGGMIGWLASILLGTDSRQGLLLNVVVGIAGAVVGGWLLGSTFGVTTINQGNFSFAGLLLSLVGAVVLLGVAKLVRVI